MELRQLNQIELDNFVSSQPHGQFLQSWSWGEFQKNVGHRVWRFGVYDNNQLIASASIIEHRLPLKKSYLYCPRGPIMDSRLTDEQNGEILKLILSKARDITIATRNAEEIFFRFEPIYNLYSISYNLQSTKPIQPSNTLILDLRLPTSDLLNNMHPKTRYNIRLAEKNQLTAKKASIDEFSKVWWLFEQTSKRDQFNLHPKNYYQKMLELKELELWVTLNPNNAIIAANITSFYGDTTTYLHGASDYNFRQLMAPNLLQWTLIQEAKNRGYKYYDFHGIASELKIENFHLRPTGYGGQVKLKIKSHPWSGVTRFKKGFGGQAVNYPGAFDFVYENGWYKIYKLIRKLKRILR